MQSMGCRLHLFSTLMFFHQSSLRDRRYLGIISFFFFFNQDLKVFCLLTSKGTDQGTVTIKSKGNLKSITINQFLSSMSSTLGSLVVFSLWRPWTLTFPQVCPPQPMQPVLQAQAGFMPLLLPFLVNILWSGNLEIATVAQIVPSPKALHQVLWLCQVGPHFFLLCFITCGFPNGPSQVLQKWAEVLHISYSIHSNYNYIEI